MYSNNLTMNFQIWGYLYFPNVDFNQVGGTCKSNILSVFTLIDFNIESRIINLVTYYDDTNTSACQLIPYVWIQVQMGHLKNKNSKQ